MFFLKNLSILLNKAGIWHFLVEIFLKYAYGIKYLLIELVVMPAVFWTEKVKLIYLR